MATTTLTAAWLRVAPVAGVGADVDPRQAGRPSAARTGVAAVQAPAPQNLSSRS
jgi:hypothetical protein